MAAAEIHRRPPPLAHRLDTTAKPRPNDDSPKVITTEAMVPLLTTYPEPPQGGTQAAPVPTIYAIRVLYTDGQGIGWFHHNTTQTPQRDDIIRVQVLPRRDSVDTPPEIEVRITGWVGDTITAVELGSD